MAMMSGSAADYLLREKDAIARDITRAMYEEMPELLQKYGERGREKCLQDMHYNIEHLVPAVDMDDPGMFAGYVEWLDGLLRSRRVDTRELVRCLELTGTVLRDRMDAVDFGPVNRALA